MTSNSFPFDPLAPIEDRECRGPGVRASIGAPHHACWRVGAVSATVVIAVSAWAETDLERIYERFPDVPLVYFVQRGKNGPVKVGQVKGVERLMPRLKALQTGSAEELVLIRVLPCLVARFENLIHRHLAEHRIRGEWFAPVPAVFALLERFGG